MEAGRRDYYGMRRRMKEEEEEDGDHKEVRKEDKL